MATSRGIDVSGYQKAQNWGEHKKTGVQFAFAKASEGMHSRDKMFDRHIADIIKAGLVPGAYHFGWPNQDPHTEASNYIQAVKAYTSGPFMHWLDLERYEDGRNYAGRTAREIQVWASTWVTLVRKAFPHNFVGVYCSSSDITAGRFPNGVELWYPAYPKQGATYAEAEAKGRPNAAGVKPLIWQFTSRPLDRSIAYVSAAQLRAMAGGKETGGTTGGEEMQLDDTVTVPDWAKKEWPTDKGLQDGAIGVDSALSGAYTHSRATHDATGELLQLVTALRNEVAALRKEVAAKAGGTGK